MENRRKMEAEARRIAAERKREEERIAREGLEIIMRRALQPPQEHCTDSSRKPRKIFRGLPTEFTDWCIRFKDNLHRLSYDLRAEIVRWYGLRVLCTCWVLFPEELRRFTEGGDCDDDDDDESFLHWACRVDGVKPVGHEPLQYVCRQTVFEVGQRWKRNRPDDDFNVSIWRQSELELIGEEGGRSRAGASLVLARRRRKTTTAPPTDGTSHYIRQLYGYFSGDICRTPFLLTRNFLLVTVTKASVASINRKRPMHLWSCLPRAFEFDSVAFLLLKQPEDTAEQQRLLSLPVPKMEMSVRIRSLAIYGGWSGIDSEKSLFGRDCVNAKSVLIGWKCLKDEWQKQKGVEGDDDDDLVALWVIVPTDGPLENQILRDSLARFPSLRDFGVSRAGRGDLIPSDVDAICRLRRLQGLAWNPRSFRNLRNVRCAYSILDSDECWRGISELLSFNRLKTMRLSALNANLPADDLEFPANTSVERIQVVSTYGVAPSLIVSLLGPFSKCVNVTSLDCPLPPFGDEFEFSSLCAMFPRLWSFKTHRGGDGREEERPLSQDWIHFVESLGRIEIAQFDLMDVSLLSSLCAPVSRLVYSYRFREKVSSPGALEYICSLLRSARGSRLKRLSIWLTLFRSSSEQLDLLREAFEESGLDEFDLRPLIGAPARHEKRVCLSVLFQRPGLAVERI